MPKRLLLVVTEPTVLKHLRRLFTRRGYACECVSTLLGALAELRRGLFPVAVVDLDLLGSDPTATARQLREASPTTRLIVLDSLAEQPAGPERARLFDAVIAKPFIAEPLLNALECPA